MPDVDATIDHFLEQAGIPSKRVSETQWAAQLTGDRKLTIPLGIALSGDRVVFESFFMRKPQENAEQFYELLLRRNARAYGVHFAIDAEGDVFLVGARAARGLDADELDRIVGSILLESDGLFDAAIKIGFAHYLEADLAWRARSAGTDNASSNG
ncbi:MAG: YbjN domain-containing protein [Actinomycetota bacterium]